MLNWVTSLLLVVSWYLSVFEVYNFDETNSLCFTNFFAICVIYQHKNWLMCNYFVHEFDTRQSKDVFPAFPSLDTSVQRLCKFLGCYSELRRRIFKPWSQVFKLHNDKSMLSRSGLFSFSVQSLIYNDHNRLLLFDWLNAWMDIIIPYGTKSYVYLSVHSYRKEWSIKNNVTNQLSTDTFILVRNIVYAAILTCFL